VVNAGWQEKVQCELDHPCCEVSEEEWLESVEKVTTRRFRTHQYYEKWAELEYRRIEIERMCPITINHHSGKDYLCENIGTCWNLEPRSNDGTCTCPEIGFAPCPTTPCRSGIPRDLSTCECHEERINRASIPSTHYDSQSEVVTVKWETHEDLNHVHDFDVVIDGRIVHCKESREELISTGKCSLDLNVLIYKPFHMQF